MWNVSAWLDEVENDPPQSAHKRQLETATAAPSAKRQRLALINGNAGRMASKSSSRLSRKAEKQSYVEGGDENAIRHVQQSPIRGSATKSALPSRAGKTSVQKRLRSGSEDEESDALETPRQTRQVGLNTLADSRFMPHFSPSRPADSVSSLSKTSTRTSRSKSPVKDTVDLEMADVPIKQRTRAEVALPECVEQLCNQLEDIADGDRLVPARLADRIKQVEFTRLRPRYILDEEPSEQDESDFTSLEEIWEDARQLERDNQSEAAWNSEVHSPIFRIALKPRKHRVSHFNLTRALPVTAFLPTKGAKTSEARLVDYTINLIPTANEQRSIEQLIASQDEKQATITQTMYTAVRTRPCAVSIETKADSGGGVKAKNQLAIWGAAHFSRLGSLFTLDGEDCEDGKESILAVHPVIHVQQHDWNMYLIVARQGGNTIHEIDLGLRLGGTRSLSELWKLRAALRCLAHWIEEEYWPALREKIKSWPV